MITFEIAILALATLGVFLLIGANVRLTHVIDGLRSLESEQRAAHTRTIKYSMDHLGWLRTINEKIYLAGVRAGGRGPTSTDGADKLTFPFEEIYLQLLN